ncbi:RNA-splicing factor [Dimargaris verticillata]|uniref:RNA-splicing factor n=1 Tax=Dimargaris verticillata TaxID=2761393 RepID=A0A9W8B2S0_9FUNG|nr:RNA-splicing factor [Dimargaris verticillata]
MGGGDLNLKKSWHPLTFRNQEKIWKAEQHAEDEQRKLDQLRKEIEEERQLQELESIQEAAGLKKKSERLEWMYNMPGTATSGPAVTEDMEEYLLGRRRVDNLLKQNDNESSQSMSAGTTDYTALSNTNANSYRDTQAKIREDPLLMIKQQEQAYLKRLMANARNSTANAGTEGGTDHQRSHGKKAKSKKKSRKHQHRSTSRRRRSRSRSPSHRRHRHRSSRHDSTPDDRQRRPSSRSPPSHRHRRRHSPSRSRSPPRRNPSPPRPR